MVSWEPWRPVPTSLGSSAQFQPQPGYRNGDIARGVQDAYITRFAASLAKFPGQVDLRWAHEMNGRWYPWSHGPANYRAAWRRIVRLFDRAGARNVRFVWSVNPNLYQHSANWQRVTRRYWPGSRYVDAVGMTMIDFGGEKDYRVSRFAPRLARPARTLPQADRPHRGQHRLRGPRRAGCSTSADCSRRTPGIDAVYWSQLPSRGTAHLDGSGLLDWDVQRDPVPRRSCARSSARAPTTHLPHPQPHPKGHSDVHPEDRSAAGARAVPPRAVRHGGLVRVGSHARPRSPSAAQEADEPSCSPAASPAPSAARSARSTTPRSTSTRASTSSPSPRCARCAATCTAPTRRPAAR